MVSCIDERETVSGRNFTSAYGYSPFGEVISQTGTEATNNFFRFSSKYQDIETGLDYYGYRYYDAGLGRWMGGTRLGISHG